MPGFSRFYTATEADALDYIRQHLPQKVQGPPQFNNSNAKRLSEIINGDVVFSTRSRNDVNQPLLSSTLPSRPVNQLLSRPSFSISHGTTYRSKDTNDGSSSDESTEWRFRSRTPSSDATSSGNTYLPLPALRVKAGVSKSSSAASDYSLKDMVMSTNDNKKHCSDYYATSPDNVLQSMDTQFSKWSYDLNEGVTAIPFVMAQAPAETHDKLIKIDRKLWTAQSELSTEGSILEDTTRAATVEGLQGRTSELTTVIKHTGVTREKSLDKGESLSNDTTLTKRAALIAKRKAEGSSSVIATKSVSQRRSAMSKNKNRRSIMPSPPPSTRKQERQSVPETKSEPTGEHSRPNILIVSQDESQQQRDVQLAIQDQRIDFNNSQQMKELMDKLGMKPVDNNDSKQ